MELSAYWGALPVIKRMILKSIYKSTRTWTVFSKFHFQIIKQHLLFTVATGFGLKFWPKPVAALNNKYCVRI